MIYESLDTIPIKLFFKIHETGDVSLLSDEKVDQNKLIAIWEELEAEHEEKYSTEKETKTLNIYKKMEELNAKYQAIITAVNYLSRIEDEELIDLVKSYGYKFTGDLEKDLQKIARESSGIKIKIERLKVQLPDVKNVKKVTIDENILGYSVLAGGGFVDTNKITHSQYYALISIGNQKMKALEKDGKQ